jgi:hypothetical protein
MRIAINGILNTKPMTNVFALECATSSTPAQADVDSIVTSVQAAYKTRFAPLQSSLVTYSLAQGIFFVPGGGEIISSIPMSGGGSAGATNELTNQTAIVLSWLSGVYWRGGKPRTYIGGMLAGQLLNSYELSAAVVTAAQGDGASFITDLNALTHGAITSCTFGFVSFSTGNAPRPSPVFYSITGCKVHERVGTQRRRLGKWIN